MRNILLTLSYDGTDFCGWQRQDAADGKKPVRTVQGEVEAALEKLHGQKIALAGSGRTDSGVHARAQAATFFSPIDSLPEANYPRALNGYLPRDVRVGAARAVPDDFHARFNATSRVYRYFISCAPEPLAMQSKYAWDVRVPLALDRLNELASCLRGEMDCAAFAASGDASKSTNRYIDRAHFFTQPGFPDGELLVFEIEANAFLWKMVRTLAGTLVTLARCGKGKREFERIIASKDRRRASATAPAAGLFLWDIKFDGVRRHV